MHLTEARVEPRSERTIVVEPRSAWLAFFPAISAIAAIYS